MTDVDAFFARLTAKARKLGLARVEALLLERRGKAERRWRKPRLLWPLFAKDFGSSE
ncbi:MAG: hypothetical protein Q8R44_14345 [Novosphingobium sp.]|nr:hypothetical protein [Novosphingobium sp.]